MWVLVIVGVALVLAHTAPAPFLFDAAAGDTAIWHMPKPPRPTVYLTFDDGPNPATTPELLDVLAREGVRATFFLIDRHITSDTASIVARMFADGHAVALHSHTRADMLKSADAFAEMLVEHADRIERLAGRRPCAAFRPHAGWRSWAMYSGARSVDHRLVGWSWMLWDWNWFRQRTTDSIVRRIGGRAASGDIVVMHDGDEKAPKTPQPQTVEATARLIPLLRGRGLSFGTICD